MEALHGGDDPARDEFRKRFNKWHMRWNTPTE